MLNYKLPKVAVRQKIFSHNHQPISTVVTENIFCIVAQREISKLVIPENTVLISITNPGSKLLEKNIINRFVDVLNVQFYDIDQKTYGELTEDGSLATEPIDFETGLIIKEFILKHKDKRFAIHCYAGVSRSAAVGCAINCLFHCDGDIEKYEKYMCPVKSHPRYFPNRTVFESIILS